MECDDCHGTSGSRQPSIAQVPLLTLSPFICSLRPCQVSFAGFIREKSNRGLILFALTGVPIELPSTAESTNFPICISSPGIGMNVSWSIFTTSRLDTSSLQSVIYALALSYKSTIIMPVVTIRVPHQHHRREALKFCLGPVD